MAVTKTDPLPTPYMTNTTPGMSRTHRLCQHRTVAHVALDEHGRPVAVEVPLSSGDVLRIDEPKEMRMFRETIAKCEDQVRQARGK